MPHTPQEKKHALTRVRRIRGQLDALERALEDGAPCAPVLQQIAAIRGAVNGLMGGVLESHMRETFAPRAETSKNEQAAVDDILRLIRSYLR